MNCTPFVRQYGILNNKWGDFYAKRENKQKISARVQEVGSGNDEGREVGLSRNSRKVWSTSPVSYTHLDVYKRQA